MTGNPGLVVVQELAGSPSVGLMAWWRLSGELLLDNLRAAWLARGLDEKLLPGNPSPVLALGRVAGEVARWAKVKASVHPMPGGWVVVAPVAGPMTPGVAYGEAIATLRLETQTEQLVASVGPQFQDILEVLHRRFLQAQTVLTVNDLSSWLAYRVRGMHATALRDTGGVYFVPETDVGTYREMAEVVHSVCASRLFEVPAMKTEKAVEAILASILAEAETVVATMETELDTGDLGARALKTREARCEAMRVKVEKYEALLGRSMDALQERLMGLKAGIVAAALVASSEGDGNA